MEELRAEVAAWLEANGIDPALVPPDSPPPTISGGHLTITTWAVDEHGTKYRDPEDPGRPAMTSVTGPLEVWPSPAVAAWIAGEELPGPVDGELLVVEPGDTLLIRVDPDMPLDTVREMKADLDGWAAEHMPDVRVVVIACEQLGVYRPSRLAHLAPLPGASGG
ncbi:hypothetical protein [Micromonospora carbonacea]|uniref:Uncharacterized protein n=1 Tax=Micromonospora carbonacea TaxID=47853 RepID=A0A1C4WZ27_9ACTN|nr:hypothetical protein [Micromonospora carbonacea]SCF01449.1 hypothetical protein GA0070563_104122 [Micromonospora carbonacea]